MRAPEKTHILQHTFETNRVCIVIPTYNNAGTLKRVLDDVLLYTSNLIVINDGSTDSTNTILSDYPEIIVHHLTRNQGKGKALRKGFRIADEAGYDYVITMDSDGQHFPDDLPVFLDVLKNKRPSDPEPLVIGSRKMDDPSVPDKSSIGNRFSTFMIWIETGIKLQDTQCGYRLYPLKIIRKLPLRTSKFELEIEVLVKAAWAGALIRNKPVKVLYDPKERVTHFRPFQDVARITLLNIYFVLALLLYIAPRNIIRRLRANGKTHDHKQVGVPSETTAN